MSQRILFFGNERLGTGLTTTAPTLQALVAAGYEVAAVIVAQNEAGKSRKARPLEIIEIAERLSIPVIAPTKLSDAKADLAKYDAGLAVLVAYGKIVPQEIIDLFPLGIINIHPSLLPAHRGPTPIESVIRNGDPETGVSLMRLTAKMDAGPIYAQETVLLKGDEQKQALADQLQTLGANMLIHHLPAIVDGSLKPTPQNDSLATYDSLITKADAVLNFSRAAETVAREVRAFSGWPRSKATVANTDITITAAHAIEGNGAAGALWIEGKQFGVYCYEGILVIDRLIPAGKKEMPADAFIAGYKPTTS